MANSLNSLRSFINLILFTLILAQNKFLSK